MASSGSVCFSRWSTSSLTFALLHRLVPLLHLGVGEAPGEVVGRVEKTDVIQLPYHILVAFIDDHRQTSESVSGRENSRAIR